jgi:hypothetical protein
VVYRCKLKVLRFGSCKSFEFQSSGQSDEEDLKP